MKTWGSLSVFLFLISGVHSKIHGQTFNETFKDDLTQTTVSSVASGFSTSYNGGVIIHKKGKFTELGAKTDQVVLTPDIGNLSAIYEHPDDAAFTWFDENENYLVFEPGENSSFNGASSSGGTFVKSVVYQRSLNGLDPLQSYYVRMLAARILPKGVDASKSKVAAGTKLRAVIYFQIPGQLGLSEKEIFSIDVNTELTHNGITSKADEFHRFAREAFTPVVTDCVLKVELIYNEVKGAPEHSLVMAMDELYFDKNNMLAMTTTEYCAGETVDLTAGSSLKTNSTYSIYKDGTLISSPLLYTDFAGYEFASAGNYRFHVQKTGMFQLTFGEEKIDVTEVHADCIVYDNPSKDNIALDEFEIVPEGNNAFQFISNIKDATEYSWDFGNGSTGVGADARSEYTFAQCPAGTCTVEITAINTLSSCVLVKDYPIYICDEANEPSLDFSRTPDSNNDLKIDISLTGNTSNADDFVWNFGDGTAPLVRPDATDFSHTYLENGKYKICVSTTYDHDYCFVEQCEEIELCLPFDAPSASSSSCGDKATFEVQNAAPGVTVGWYQKAHGGADGSAYQLISTDNPFTRTFVNQILDFDFDRNVSIYAVVFDGCGKGSPEKVTVNVTNGPSPEFYAYLNKGTHVDFQSLYNASKSVTYAWTLKFYNGSSLLATKTSTTSGGSEALPQNTTDVEVTLDISYSGTTCVSTKTQGVCIPSENRDCCDGCVTTN